MKYLSLPKLYKGIKGDEEVSAQDLMRETEKLINKLARRQTMKLCEDEMPLAMLDAINLLAKKKIVRLVEV